MSTKTTVGNNNTSLRDALLYDTLSRAAPDSEGEAHQSILNNLNHYVEIVHHSSYNAELLQCEYTEGFLR